MSIQDLPDELLIQILEYVPNLPCQCVVSKQFNIIAHDIKKRVFKNPNKYIEDLSSPIYFLLHNDGYRKQVWDKAIVKGHLDLIIKLDKLGYKFDVNGSMFRAAENGHEYLAVFFLEKGADRLNEGLACAAFGGHKTLVDFFIQQGADVWWGMTHAARGGHKDLVDFFISKGFTDWNDGMTFASRGGHKNLVEFFINLGASDWNRGMKNAAFGGHLDLVNFFINLGADDWNLGMTYAALGNHKALEDFFIGIGTNN